MFSIIMWHSIELGQMTRKLESVLKGESHALDNFRDLASAVAIGTGHFLHHGWVHPHPVGIGRRCSCNKARPRPKRCLIEAGSKRPRMKSIKLLIVVDESPATR